MNLVVYSGIAYEDDWVKLARVDTLKTYCWKRGDTVSSVVAEFFRITSSQKKLISENIK